jgi:hypothetical protein
MPCPPRGSARDFADRVDDIRIGAAAADVAAHAFAQLGGGEHRFGGQVAADVARDAALDFVEDRDGRTYLARRAIAALVAVMLHESGLHRMQPGGRAESLDRGDLGALVHHGQAEAGIDAAAIDDDRTRAALALVAALLGAGQLQVLAQQVEQGGAGVDLHLVTLAVDRQGDLARDRRGRRRRCAGAAGLHLGGRDRGHRGGRGGQRAADHEAAPGVIDFAGVVHEACFLERCPNEVSNVTSSSMHDSCRVSA